MILEGTPRYSPFSPPTIRMILRRMRIFPQSLLPPFPLPLPRPWRATHYESAACCVHMWLDANESASRASHPYLCNGSSLLFPSYLMIKRWESGLSTLIHLAYRSRKPEPPPPYLFISSHTHVSFSLWSGWRDFKPFLAYHCACILSIVHRLLVKKNFEEKRRICGL